MFHASSIMLGTGVFVGLGIVANVAGSATGWAITLAALLALLNSLAEVQVAASAEAEPWTWLQFTRSWTLFLAKLTSAATASLGVAGYLLNGLGYTDPIWLIPTALVVVVLITVAVLQQRILLRWPRFTVIVATLALLVLIGAGATRIQVSGPEFFAPGVLIDWPALLQATALMTVVYAGYEPLALQRAGIQPTFSAIRLAILFLWLLCLGIGLVGFGTIGPTALGTAVEAFAAPLLPVMQYLAVPLGTQLISLGAIAAMLKMLVTLLPQLADQLLKISQFGQLSPAGLVDSGADSGVVATPSAERNFVLSASWAVKLVGIGLGCIVLVGNVRAIWSFSAVAFLMHYAVVHGMALTRWPLRLSIGWLSVGWLNWLGLALCLLLAFQVEWEFWLVNLGLMALGLIWQGVNRWSDEEE
jgi:basic amino acid/polyamine antiporter, APA family